jgi:hypothetical protein
MVDIYLSPTGYKAFIQDFRRHCHGRPVGTVTYRYRTPGGDVKEFRFNTGNEYLVAVKNGAQAPWRPLSAYEEHYAHMAAVDWVGQPAIITAFNADFSQPYDNWSGSLRLICLVTAEAVRSEPIYRLCQRAVHGHGGFRYRDVWPMINSYEASRALNGLGAGRFRALRDEDYR